MRAAPLCRAHRSSDRRPPARHRPAPPAPNIPRKNWHALTRLDENRAKCQLALKAGKFYTSVTNMCVWGNHSTTQVPDFLNARIGGERALLASCQLPRAGLV